MSSSEKKPHLNSLSLRDLYEMLPRGSFAKFECESALLLLMGHRLSDFERGKGNEMGRLEDLEKQLTENHLLPLRNKIVDLRDHGSNVEKAFSSGETISYFQSIQKTLAYDFNKLSEKLGRPLSEQEIEYDKLWIKELIEFEPDAEKFCTNENYVENVIIRISANYLAAVEEGQYDSEEWLRSTDFMQATFYVEQIMNNEQNETRPLSCKSMLLERHSGIKSRNRGFSQGTMFEIMQMKDNQDLRSNYMVRKRCLAHLPFQSVLLPKDDCAITLSAAHIDDIAEACYMPSELRKNEYEVWTTAYVNDVGALDLGKRVARPLRASEIFLTCPGRTRALIDEIGKTALDFYDETACRITVLTASSIYGEDSETVLYRFFGAIALKSKDDQSNAAIFRTNSGSCIFSCFKITWLEKEVDVERIVHEGMREEEINRVAEIEKKVVARWKQILQLFYNNDRNYQALEESVMKELKQILGEEKPFEEEKISSHKHYNNSLMFRPIRKPQSIGDYLAEPPLGGTLTDVTDGENYVLSKTGRKIYVVREGNNLRLLRKGVPKILYYVSRLEFSISNLFNFKTECRELLVNPHIGTSTILEMMLSQTERPDAVKYALRFMEDTGVSCSMTSACFLSRKEDGELNISAVLTARTLSTADCYIDLKNGTIHIIIGTRMLKLTQIRQRVYHAEPCAVDYSLRRAHINFDDILVGITIQK